MNDCLVFFEDEPPYIEQVAAGRLYFSYLLGSGAQWEKRPITRYTAATAGGQQDYLYASYPDQPSAEQLAAAVAKLKPRAVTG